jgi:hypothetical protein
MGVQTTQHKWQRPKSDREKTMLIVQQTFSKKASPAQLSNTRNKPLQGRRKRVCVNSTQTHTEVGTDSNPKESTY